MLQTILPHITAHPAAGMNASGVPTTARTMVIAPKAAQSHISDDIKSSVRFLLAYAASVPSEFESRPERRRGWDPPDLALLVLQP